MRERERSLELMSRCSCVALLLLLSILYNARIVVPAHYTLDVRLHMRVCFCERAPYQSVYTVQHSFHITMKNEGWGFKED